MHRPATKRILFLTIFVDLLGFGIIIPILPYISSTYLPPALQGKGAALLMVSFSLLQMLFSPLWGRLSDRYGRRPILLVSLGGSTASYLLFALADSYGLLLFSRILAGITGANITAAQAAMSDVTEEKDRTAGMGLIGMAFGLGFALGPVLGGGATRLWEWLHPAALGHLSHAGPGLAAAAICGVNFIWALLRLPESLPPQKRGQVSFHRFASVRETVDNLRHPAIGPLIILFFLITFAFSNLEVSFVLYAKNVLGLTMEWVFGIFVYIGFLMALVQGVLVRRLVHYVPEPIQIIAGLMILTVGLAILPGVARLGWVVLALTVLSPGQGIAMPSILSLISRSSSRQRQGGVMGTSQAASSLARIIGPAFGGVIYDLAGPRWPFWTAAGIMVLAVGWAFHARRRLLLYGPGGVDEAGAVDGPLEIQPHGA